jgi:hypothetical protein
MVEVMAEEGEVGAWQKSWGVRIRMLIEPKLVGKRTKLNLNTHLVLLS